MIIKILLLASLGSAALLALRDRFPVAGLAVRRLAALVVLSGGAVAIVFPNLVTWLANRVGVGRGTDLVLYVLAIVSLFGWIAAYRRFRDLEDKIVALTRHQAISAFEREAREAPPSTQPAMPHLAGRSPEEVVS